MSETIYGEAKPSRETDESEIERTDLQIDKPTKLKLGYKEYEIVKKEEVIDLPNECYGKIDYDKETIEIATKFNQKQQNATFLHEMVHGIFEKLDLIELQHNEQIVNQVAQTLYEIILDNPHIFTMKDI